MKRNTTILMFILILLLTACADVTNIEQCTDSTQAYGFWAGLWHGIIAGFAFIGSLFFDDIAVYAVNNNGGWYDFGFVLGVGALIGGGSRASK